MSKKVVLELPGCHMDCIELLLNFSVPCFSVVQDLADKVHGLLFDFRRGFRQFNSNNCADNCAGSYNV
jgi:hypothetical protein